MGACASDGIIAYEEREYDKYAYCWLILGIGPNGPLPCTRDFRILPETG
jgi:hypothetical protein